MTPVSDGVKERTPDGFHHQGPDAPSAHRRPSYPLSGCVPAEPDSVSPGSIRLASTEQPGKPPSDTEVMPPKILPCETPRGPQITRLVWRRAIFQSFGSMQVRIFSRKY